MPIKTDSISRVLRQRVRVRLVWEPRRTPEKVKKWVGCNKSS